ncbi:hypothetical protein GMC59_00760 [Turicibacter sanguinis]|nr:hypothetical protein [Turicibacter sanguinis]MTP62854.1 hypothetical protein [Turicibacter sanguinis]
MELLNNKWNVCKKQIIVSAPTFYFTNDSNRILTPLHKANKRGTSGSKWKQAYQAVKHNRKNSLKLATIENLLHAMGALYILNLYYRDEMIPIGRVYMSNNVFDSRGGSDIFSVFTYRATVLSMSLNMGDNSIISQNENDLDKAIYIIKYDNASFEQMYDGFCKDNEITLNNFYNSPEIISYLQAHPDYKVESINKTCLDVGGIDLLRKVMSFTHSGSNDTKVEAILNKHRNIYPIYSSEN